MFQVNIITLFALFGTLQGFIFAIIFWTRNKQVSNKIFALLLLVTSIRIAKNIVVHLSELNPEFRWDTQITQTLIYIGITHQFAIGPLFWFYFRSKSGSGFNLKKQHLVHFIPYLILVLASPFLHWSFWENGGLVVSYISLLLYYILSFRYFLKHLQEYQTGELMWLKGIMIVTTILLFLYSPALFHYIGYIGGAIIYAIILVFVGYLMLQKKDSFSIFRTKYQESQLDTERVKLIKIKLEEKLKTEKYYLDPNLTLTSLAEHLGIPSHHLSQVINMEYKKSYTAFVNFYRLNELVSKLKDEKLNHIKIVSLAYDSGFNSQPTFNTLFKKEYNMTPSQYRKQGAYNRISK